LPLTWNGRQVQFKLEFMAPTSSFKDRGTEAMINLLAHQGVTRVCDDSSGNAGASVAAYAARAGMQADVFVPAYASSAKQTQIAVYGAVVHPIPGVRADAKYAAWQEAERGGTLASHAYHPAFLAGQQTVTWELWEQLGRRAPDWYVVPVGQGVHLLGVWLGFRRLWQAGLIESLPRLVAVQATVLAPVCRALEAGLDSVSALEPSYTSVAEGLAIAEPVRGSRLLEAIRETQGTCLAVEDRATLRAQQELAQRGLYVEPTSATAVAALGAVLQRAAPDETVVVPLTGSGLKGSPNVQPALSPASTRLEHATGLYADREQL
jgi:threonine synthase